MPMVSQERIWDCVITNLHSLSVLRARQESLVEFAKLMRFSLRDVDQGLSHAIVMGGAVGAGDVWPIGWREARGHLSTQQVQAVEAAYSKIVEAFPQDLKEGNEAVFV